MSDKQFTLLVWWAWQAENIVHLCRRVLVGEITSHNKMSEQVIASTETQF